MNINNLSNPVFGKIVESVANNVYSVTLVNGRSVQLKSQQMRMAPDGTDFHSIMSELIPKPGSLSGSAGGTYLSGSDNDGADLTDSIPGILPNLDGFFCVKEKCETVSEGGNSAVGETVDVNSGSGGAGLGSAVGATVDVNSRSGGAGLGSAAGATVGETIGATVGVGEDGGQVAGSYKKLFIVSIILFCP